MPPAPLGGTRLLRCPAEVMSLTGHRDRTSWWQWARRAGLPLIRLSARKYVIEESALRDWLASRTLGRLRKGRAA